MLKSLAKFSTKVYSNWALCKSLHVTSKIFQQYYRKTFARKYVCAGYKAFQYAIKSEEITSVVFSSWSKLDSALFNVKFLISPKDSFQFTVAGSWSLAWQEEIQWMYRDGWLQKHWQITILFTTEVQILKAPNEFTASPPQAASPAVKQVFTEVNLVRDTNTRVITFW